MSSNSEIGQRYAKALYELTEEAKKTSSVEKDLIAINSLLKDNEELKGIINSAIISREDQVNAMNSILHLIKAEKLTIKFISTIIINGRVIIIPEIINEFIKNLAHSRDEVSAEIITSIPILKDTENIIKSVVSKIAKTEKISLNTTIDESLIGGLIIRVGSTMIDGSIKTKLNRLKMIMKGV